MPNKLILGLVLGLIVGVGIGYFAHRPAPLDARTAARFPGLRNFIETQGRSTPASSVSTEPAKHFAKINSIPHGAEIFIDGNDTHLRTPAAVEVEAGKKFTLALKAQGFHELVEKDLDIDSGLIHRAFILRR